MYVAVVGVSAGAGEPAACRAQRRLTLCALCAPPPAPPAASPRTFCCPAWELLSWQVRVVCWASCWSSAWVAGRQLASCLPCRPAALAVLCRGRRNRHATHLAMPFLSMQMWGSGAHLTCQQLLHLQRNQSGLGWAGCRRPVPSLFARPAADPCHCCRRLFPAAPPQPSAVPHIPH